MFQGGGVTLLWHTAAGRWQVGTLLALAQCSFKMDRCVCKVCFKVAL